MAYTSPVTQPEFIIGMLGIVGMVAVGGWFFVRRFLNSPKPAEPWGIEVTEALESGEATPLCHRCLSPHDELVNFCPVCGATVGQYTNLLPYLYIFSIGDLLRVGTRTPFR